LRHIFNAKEDYMKYLLVLLKGIAMGAADIIPGVSGGTIAFITGIYDKLLESINAINFKLLKVIKNDGLKAAWNKINGLFLLSLFAGIAISILSLSKFLAFLLETHPISVWSFFFGLIVASIFYVGKQIAEWNFAAIIGLILGAILVVVVSLLPALGDANSLGYIFICGVIAICAMILPGISGSFLLLVLGAYQTILTALNDRDFAIIFTFMAGAIIGLLSFSRFLKWVLDNYKNTTIAVLTGFLVGSLYKIWPWKETIETRINSHGEVVPFIQENIYPNGQIGGAILCATIGFSIIFIIEGIANLAENKEKKHS